MQREGMKTILIVGLGSIRRRHLDVIRAVSPEMRIVVLRRPESRGADDVPCGVTVVRHLEEALVLRPEAAILANPAPFHVDTALALAEAGVHLLIEKPFSVSLDGVEKLINLCHSRRLVLQVGYCLRFTPSLVALKEVVERGDIGDVLSLEAEVGQYLPDWRPGQDYRQTVSAQAHLGGGVLWELSHELDLARWMAGEVAELEAKVERSGQLEIDVEDTARLSLVFDNGAKGEVRLDMLQRPANRFCKVVGSRGCALWHGIAGETKVMTADEGDWKIVHSPGGDEPDAMYRQQFRHFIGCIEEGRAPLVGGVDGKKVVELVLAAKQAAEQDKRISL